MNRSNTYGIENVAANHDATRQTSTSVAANTKLMARHAREGHNDSPVPAEDAPADWDGGRGEEDHDECRDAADDERDAETGDDLRHFLPEVGPLDLLLRRAPGDVVREHVREEGLRQVDTETAEEEEAVRAELARLRKQRVYGADVQEGDPGEVLDDGVEEGTRAEAVLEQREPEVTGAREDDRAGQPNLETVLVVPVDLQKRVSTGAKPGGQKRLGLTGRFHPRRK